MTSDRQYPRVLGSIEALFRYPIEGNRGIARLVVGGMAFLAPVVLFVAGWVENATIGGQLPVAVWAALSLSLLGPVLATGYAVDVLRATIRGEPEPPSYPGIDRVAVDGVFAWALGAVYLVPGAVIAGLILAPAFGGSVDGGNWQRILWTSVAVLVYYSVASYFYPISLCAYAHEGRFAAAFSPRRFKVVGLDAEYALGWTVGSSMLVPGLMFAATLWMVVVGAVLGFYVLVLSARLVALGYARSLGFGREAGDGDATERRPRGRAEW